MTERTEERKNRFTGQREFLTQEEADLHDKVFYHVINAALFLCGINLILKQFL